MTKVSFEPGWGLRHTDDIGSMGAPVSFLTEIFAAIVLWLSTAALCQFGVAVEDELARIKPRVERSVARTPRMAPRAEAPTIVAPMLAPEGDVRAVTA